ncbi:AAA family ATPase [Bradyrhizobium sp. 200]|uniref:AAA family ATPase n=1 Tax=Bradyrhizobium sp. 200 TaxID=2782665 RepID=UPI0020004F62|nr:AAA family ATPase [Bradyrhizobium sp. 200]UPJ48726.1 AAA family ATPase [Bradyrhizobium sp. 200]
MIIELFGPPAAGKTTLAHALATELEKNGFDIQLIVSSRPAERGSIQVESTRALSWWRTALAAPLSRAAKLVSAGPVLLACARSDELTASLMDLLPPRTLLWSVRYRRYLSLLSRSWKMASTSDRIVIVDQGFLTALCSLALLARSADRRGIARGLELIPRPDLLVRLDAPRDILEARLRARLGRQGAVERLFEFNLQTSLQQIDTTSEVAHMFQEQGGRMMHVSSLDRRLLEKAVDRIVREAKSWDEEIDPVYRSLVERRRIVRAAR